jgi:hypothetical protein
MARQKRPSDAVQFTRESAERIAGVIRSAELAVPAAAPLTFERRFPERVPKQVRAATFSGSWAIGASKVVQFSYAPTATQAVTNLSWPITHNHTSAENCIVGREGTSWWLVVPVLSTATAVFATQTATAVFVTGTATQVFYTGSATQSITNGISFTRSTINYVTDVSASLNTSDCTITVSKTTDSTEVVTDASPVTGTITVQTTTATGSYITGTTTGVFIQQTATAAYLRLRVP